MSLPTNEERPPYLKAADAIREEIAAGRLKPGQQLPALRELEERFGIANMTARSAVRVLRDEGLVYSVQGRGTFVREAPAKTEKAGGEPGTEPAAELSEVFELLRTTLAQVQRMDEKIARLEERVEEFERGER